MSDHEGAVGSRNDPGIVMVYEVGQPMRRRKCRCGCGRRVTHAAMHNGVCLTAGCEWSTRVWVRDGVKSFAGSKVFGTIRSNDQGTA